MLSKTPTTEQHKTLCALALKSRKTDTYVPVTKSWFYFSVDPGCYCSDKSLWQTQRELGIHRLWEIPGKYQGSVV